MDKRQLYNSYTVCYCQKNQTVQLGWKLYGFGNMFVTYPLLALSTVFIVVTLLSEDYTSSLFLLFVVSIGILNIIFGYRAMYNLLTKANHTRHCASSVSIRAAPYYGIYSRYKLIGKVKSNETSTIKKPRGR